MKFKVELEKIEEMNLRRIFKRKKRQLTLEERRVVGEIYKHKNCIYCRYLVAALHWWCTNDKAVKVRHTNIPGVNHCPYWGADKSYIREILKKNRKCQKN